MSRYIVTKSYPNGVTMTYAYGYDNPLQEFFLSFKDSRTYDEFIWFVGMGGCHPGTNGEMLKAIQFFELFDVIPAEHIKCIGEDRPLPWDERTMKEDTRPRFIHKGEGKTHVTVDQEIARHQASQRHKVGNVIVVVKEGPDGEQFLSLAD